MRSQGDNDGFRSSLPNRRKLAQSVSFGSGGGKRSAAGLLPRRAPTLGTKVLGEHFAT